MVLLVLRQVKGQVLAHMDLVAELAVMERLVARHLVKAVLVA
jgi:hypothetical protein